MREKIKRMMEKYGTQLCCLAIAVAPIAATGCRGLYYQPKEPEGLAEFVRAGKEVRRDS